MLLFMMREILNLRQAVHIGTLIFRHFVAVVSQACGILVVGGYDKIVLLGVSKALSSIYSYVIVLTP